MQSDDSDDEEKDLPALTGVARASATQPNKSKRRFMHSLIFKYLNTKYARKLQNPLRRVMLHHLDWRSHMQRIFATYRRFPTARYALVKWAASVEWYMFTPYLASLLSRTFAQHLFNACIRRGLRRLPTKKVLDALLPMFRGLRSSDLTEKLAKIPSPTSFHHRARPNVPKFKGTTSTYLRKQKRATMIALLAMYRMQCRVRNDVFVDMLVNIDERREFVSQIQWQTAVHVQLRLQGETRFDASTDSGAMHALGAMLDRSIVDARTDAGAASAESRTVESKTVESKTSLETMSLEEKTSKNTPKIRPYPPGILLRVFKKYFAKHAQAELMEKMLRLRLKVENMDRLQRFTPEHRHRIRKDRVEDRLRFYAGMKSIPWYLGLFRKTKIYWRNMGRRLHQLRKKIHPKGKSIPHFVKVLNKVMPKVHKMRPRINRFTFNTDPKKPSDERIRKVYAAFQSKVYTSARKEIAISNRDLQRVFTIPTLVCHPNQHWQGIEWSEGLTTSIAEWLRKKYAVIRKIVHPPDEHSSDGAEEKTPPMFHFTAARLHSHGNAVFIFGYEAQQILANFNHVRFDFQGLNHLRGHIARFIRNITSRRNAMHIEITFCMCRLIWLIIREMLTRIDPDTASMPMLVMKESLTILCKTLMRFGRRGFSYPDVGLRAIRALRNTYC